MRQDVGNRVDTVRTSLAPARIAHHLLKSLSMFR
jgi:hypothetical protein